MAVQVDEEVYREWGVMLLNYIVICRHFNLTEQQMREFGIGEKIIDKIRTLETYMILSKAQKQDEQTDQK